jgi:hypothetical protein
MAAEAAGSEQRQKPGQRCGGRGGPARYPREPAQAGIASADRTARRLVATGALGVAARAHRDPFPTAGGASRSKFTSTILRAESETPLRRT